MKTIITLATILLLASCSKKSSDLNQTPAAKVQLVTWNQVSTPFSIKFTVDFVITRSVTKVNLIRAKDLKIASSVKTPVTGKYTMYFVDQYLPNYLMHEMFYFEFLMADGSKIVAEPFQVY